jgi:hypothetical protein
MHMCELFPLFLLTSSMCVMCARTLHPPFAFRIAVREVVAVVHYLSVFVDQASVLYGKMYILADVKLS